MLPAQKKSTKLTGFNFSYTMSPVLGPGGELWNLGFKFKFSTNGEWAEALRIGLLIMGCFRNEYVGEYTDFTGRFRLSSVLDY